VVAQEVKALSAQTQRATEEIKANIAALQKNAGASIDAVHRISEVIGAIRPLFGTVAGATDQQIATINELSSSATELRNSSLRLPTASTTSSTPRPAPTSTARQSSNRANRSRDWRRS